jgi:hypothetical protein
VDVLTAVLCIQPCGNVSSLTRAPCEDDQVYLGHIRDAIADIEAYTSVGRDGFLGYRMRLDAVIRKLEIIGEAVLLALVRQRTKPTTSDPLEGDCRHA